MINKHFKAKTIDHNAKKYTDEAKKAISEGDLEEAEELLKTASQMYPNSVNIKVLLSDVRVEGLKNDRVSAKFASSNKNHRIKSNKIIKNTESNENKSSDNNKVMENSFRIRTKLLLLKALAAENIDKNCNNLLTENTNTTKIKEYVMDAITAYTNGNIDEAEHLLFEAEDMYRAFEHNNNEENFEKKPVESISILNNVNIINEFDSNSKKCIENAQLALKMGKLENAEQFLMDVERNCPLMVKNKDLLQQCQAAMVPNSASSNTNSTTKLTEKKPIRSKKYTRLMNLWKIFDKEGFNNRNSKPDTCPSSNGTSDKKPIQKHTCNVNTTTKKPFRISTIPEEMPQNTNNELKIQYNNNLNNEDKKYLPKIAANIIDGVDFEKSKGHLGPTNNLSHNQDSENMSENVPGSSNEINNKQFHKNEELIISKQKTAESIKVCNTQNVGIDTVESSHIHDSPLNNNKTERNLASPGDYFGTNSGIHHTAKIQKLQAISMMSESLEKIFETEEFQNYQPVDLTVTNHDELLACLEVAQKALSSDNFEKAERFLQKSFRMNPTREIQKLLADVQLIIETRKQTKPPNINDNDNVENETNIYEYPVTRRKNKNSNNRQNRVSLDIQSKIEATLDAAIVASNENNMVLTFDLLESVYDLNPTEHNKNLLVNVKNSKPTQKKSRCIIT